MLSLEANKWEKRGYGATHCYGCLCNTCSNNVELLSWYVIIGGTEKPCFSCDECYHYDRNAQKQDQWRSACPHYVEVKASEVK